MPLLKIAQNHKEFKEDFHMNTYSFAPEHKAVWMRFYDDMDGDIDKLFDFAKKAEIANPAIWVDSLHQFLFGTFSGSYKLLKKAAKTFETFLKQVAENHMKDPKDRWWYLIKGVNNQQFCRIMQHAAELKETQQCVGYINARIRDFGDILYSEFLLAKTPQKKEFKSIASDLNKKAYNLEKEAGKGLTHKAGDIIKHAMHGNEEFEIVEVLEDEDMMIVQDRNGNEFYVFDVWNVLE